MAPNKIDKVSDSLELLLSRKRPQTIKHLIWDSHAPAFAVQ